jgi:hypothetical protein
MYNSAYRNKLMSVDQRGDIERTNMQHAFRGCENLAILASDSPDLSKVSNMSYMFAGAINLTGNFNGRDTSNVTNMSHIFQSASGFNQDLDGRNVENVTTMYNMFNGARSFNGSLSGRKTDSLT